MIVKTPHRNAEGNAKDRESHETCRVRQRVEEVGGGWGGGGGGRYIGRSQPTDWLVECCFTSTETGVGLLGTGAQGGHLDFHTAPEL